MLWTWWFELVLLCVCVCPRENRWRKLLYVLHLNSLWIMRALSHPLTSFFCFGPERRSKIAHHVRLILWARLCRLCAKHFTNTELSNARNRLHTQLYVQLKDAVRVWFLPLNCCGTIAIDMDETEWSVFKYSKQTIKRKRDDHNNASVVYLSRHMLNIQNFGRIKSMQIN